MIEWFSLICRMARLAFEAQNAAAFRLLRASAGASKAMPDEIIREEMALIPEKSPVAIALKKASRRARQADYRNGPASWHRCAEAAR